MQRSLMALVAALALLWTAVQVRAQTAPAPAQAAGAQTVPTLAPGTIIGAELSKGIDAKKAKVGQQVVAKSLGDMRDTSGNLVIPKGAKLIGHVTTVKASSKQDRQSSLGIIFDKVEVKQGKETKEVGVHAAIQALEEPQASPMMQGQEPSERPAGGAPSGGQPGMGSGSRPGGMPGGASGGQGQGGEMGGGGGMGPGGGASAAPQITANSHGVIGDPNMTLGPQASPTEGSVITSSRGNVKLDSGTLLVLRVIGQ